MDALDLIEDGLNLRMPVSYDEIYERWGPKRVVHDTETVAAQAKLTEIKLKFSEWAWSDEGRALELCRIYNERFNGLRERRFDGSHLQLPGMNSNIALRPHQKDGIWRVMQSRATLLGHVVGSGKTFLMIAAAMELKRLGICHKAMAVVPNHLTTQGETEAYRLYPGIKVLSPSKDDLTASQRGELISRISTGDYDLVIIPHSTFKLLPVSPETIARYVQREIDTLEAYLEGLGDDESRGQKRAVKEIRRAIKTLTVKLKDYESEIKRDSKHTVRWEELGVDLLLIDECHYFKNLYCPVISRKRCDHSGGFPPFCTEVNATLHRSRCDWVVFIQ
jgi:N12 class adenine-specific DNA methylase